jgi:hypothetical protein
LVWGIKTSQTQTVVDLIWNHTNLISILDYLLSSQVHLSFCLLLFNIFFVFKKNNCINKITVQNFLIIRFVDIRFIYAWHCYSRCKWYTPHQGNLVTSYFQSVSATDVFWEMFLLTNLFRQSYLWCCRWKCFFLQKTFVHPGWAICGYRFKEVNLNLSILNLW